MSKRELDRAAVIARVLEKRLTQREAARALGLTDRQVRRLCRRVQQEGMGGLASRARGRPGNRRLPGALRSKVMAIIREHYHDFGPTLAGEKLGELHRVNLSVETLRRWMMADGLWVDRKQRERRPQRPRRRRPCRGELVQIDGSDHHWFEDRGPRCTLLVYIDDATSELMELRFVESESALSYFAATRAYLQRHGKPVALYSDKASTFRVAKSQAVGGAGVTQFGRALTSLNIDIICASTPAAKGRVERANLTLQDRLVKELRLQGISDMATANGWVDGFRRDHNRRFAKPPLSEHDAHRGGPCTPAADDQARREDAARRNAAQRRPKPVGQGARMIERADRASLWTGLWPDHSRCGRTGRPHCRCHWIKTGHFYFGEKRTFLFCSDIRSHEAANPPY